jgi:hypothetical protein
MKRTLIITGYTDSVRSIDSTDNTMEEVFDITLPSKIKYAKKHGYDFLAMQSFGSDKSGNYKDTDIGFLRALRTFEMLESYDTVMWIDADSLITNLNYKIEDFLVPSEYAFYASYDWLGTNSLSGGNFIIQNNESTKDFLKSFYELSKHYNEEQTTLNVMYFNMINKNYIKILEHKFLGSVPSIDDYTTEIWGKRPSPPYPWTPESFLVHLTGIANKERIHMLSTIYKDYL